MTSIYTQTFIQGQIIAKADKTSLLFDAGIDRVLHIAGLPPHVAAHTAAAFNRAMQAVPSGDGWDYTTKSGVWHISRDPAMGTVFLAQHEDVTGDGDPGYLFAQSDSLIGCMDVVDDVEAEEACTECHALVGQDALIEMADDRFLCRSCLWAEAEHQQGLKEMADDDRAHAMMERAAE